MHDQSNSWSIQLINSFSSNWFTLLLLCTSAPLVLYCYRFGRGSRPVKREPVDLLLEDYDVSLCQRVGIRNYYTKDHIITCDGCTSGKSIILYVESLSDRFLLMRTQEDLSSDMELLVYSMFFLWFWYDILSCGMTWNIWNCLFYQLFWRELYF